MSRPGTRDQLLDMAERLFAQRGIANVSDRKVAEMAGNSNKSAVAYYFGDRQGLLRALLDRHLEPLESPRQTLFEESQSLLGDVRAFVLPITGAFSRLPTPSWRARFLNLAAHEPVTAELMRSSADQAPAAARIFNSIVRRLDHLPAAVVTARVGLMTYMIAAACSEEERRSEESGIPGSWSAAGHNLCDAVAGMLAAPVTETDHHH